MPFTIDKGIRTAAAIGELNGDDQFELLVGNYSGGLHFYKGSDQPPVSGLNKINENHLLKISPNPAGNMVRIVSTLKEPRVYLEVTDSFGHLHLAQWFNNYSEYNLDVSGLPAGIYIVRCSAVKEGTSQTGRFVKMSP